MKIKNYLTVALRVFNKKKLYTSINIIGLVLGGASFLVLLMIAQYELSYDRYHQKADHLYRIGLKGDISGNAIQIPYVGAPCGEVLVNEISEVLDATRLYGFGAVYMLDINGAKFKEDKVIYADENFFNVFSIKMIYGDPATALKEPNTAVLSKTMANKYFGNTDPVGKLINTAMQNGEKVAIKITGVYENIPRNTHFDFDMLISMVSNPDSRGEYWLANNFYTYLVLEEDSDIEALENKFPALLKKYLGNDLREFFDTSVEDFFKSQDHINFFVQPVTAIHLHSKLENELGKNNDIIYVYILLSIGILMLVVACINFVNLTTAGFADRAREIGIRKVVGSTRSQIITQYMLNAVLITFIALMISLSVIQFLLPAVNNLLEMDLALDLLDLSFTVKLIIGWAIVSLLAGSYPSFYLSFFKPTEVLKARLRSGTRNGIFRNSLVVFQFTISTVLIICTMVVYNQLKLIRSKDLGFDKSNLIIVYNMDLMSPQKSRSFRDILSMQPNIIRASLSRHAPFEAEKDYDGFVDEGKTYRMQKALVDNNYIQTLGIEIVMGTDFESENVFSEVLINESAMAAFGWNNIEDKTIKMVSGPDEYPVAGVVKDFHSESLMLPKEPVVFFNGGNPSYLLIKSKANTLNRTLSIIKQQWENNVVEIPFEYSFMDEQIGKAHRSIEDLNIVLKVFTGLIICVAGLGLFSLSAYSAEQKKREVGIRKVLGAFEKDIVLMFFQNFLRLAILAIIISIPVAWYICGLWLQAFAYKVSFGILPSVVASAILLLVALSTTTLHSLRLAHTNPVSIIKND